MRSYEIKFVRDLDVNKNLDTKLKTLLALCFANQTIFNERRYFKEAPAYRWYLESDDEIISHVALHEKIITVDNKKIKIGGIAEVCTHPDYRYKGLTKIILKLADDWLIKQGYKYAMLFGDNRVYSSSGYFNIDNEIKYVEYLTNEVKIERNKDVMVKLLSGEPWPNGLVDLNGPTF